MKTLGAKPLPDMTPSDIARFWSNVEIGAPNECWPWKLSRFAGGYGQMTINGRTVKAHRVAFKLFHGYDPDGQMVLHSCDNPPCCNGAHLSAGSGADNQAECIQRGRNNPATGSRHGSQTHPERWARGERVASAILTATQVEELRALHLTGNYSQATLAERFGVKRETVGRIVRGENWAHIPSDRESAIAVGNRNRVRIGESNTSAKLTESDVRAIRARYADGNVTQRQLAVEFGVNRETIILILHRRTWKHVH